MSAIRRALIRVSGEMLLVEACSVALVRMAERFLRELIMMGTERS